MKKGADKILNVMGYGSGDSVTNQFAAYFESLITSGVNAKPSFQARFATWKKK